MKTHEELMAVAIKLRHQYKCSVVVSLEAHARAYDHSGTEPESKTQPPHEAYRVHIIGATNESFNHPTLEAAEQAAHDFMRPESLLDKANKLEAEAAKCRELAKEEQPA